MFLLCLLAALAAYAVGTAPAWADTSGPNYAGNGTSVTGVGTVVWTNPGNITAADTSYATCALSSSAQSTYLWATNFGFAIPAGNIINGIQVSIMRQSADSTSSPYIRDVVVSLIKGGAVTGDNKAATGRTGLRP